MIKYIDAEKLVAELTKMQFTLDAAYRKPQSDNIVRAISLEYDDIISLIDSLQQEQEQYVIGGQVFGATDIEQLYKGKVYIVSKLVQDKEFGIYPGKRVKMLLIKD